MFFLIRNINLFLDKIPLNDVWLFKLSNYTWFQLIPSNSDSFEARFCHSSVIVGEKIYVFGGIFAFDFLFNL